MHFTNSSWFDLFEKGEEGNDNPHAENDDSNDTNVKRVQLQQNNFREPFNNNQYDKIICSM